MARQMTEFGKLVKIKLIENNMTQVELALELGTTTQYLTKIFVGERSGDKYIKKISSILDMPISA